MNFDQLYIDLKNQVVPLLGKTLTLTKDYAFDLFGRYIKYLLIKDISLFILELSIMGFLIYSVYRIFHYFKNSDTGSDAQAGYIILVSIIFIAGAFIAHDLCVNYSNILADIITPETRIYNLIK